MSVVMADDSLIRTIDNLPLDDYRKYDQDKKARQEGDLIKESSVVQNFMGLDTTKQTLPSEVDRIFNLDTKGPTWSAIAAPASFYSQKGRIFNHDQAISAFGSDDQIDAMKNRIDGIAENSAKRRQAPSQEALRPSEKRQRPESDLKENTVQDEAHKLQSMLSEVSKINKAIKDIHGAIAGFQKG